MTDLLATTAFGAARYGASAEVRGRLIFFDRLWLFDNLFAAIEAVRRNAVSQVCLSGGRINRQRGFLELVVCTSHATCRRGLTTLSEPPLHILQCLSGMTATQKIFNSPAAANARGSHQFDCLLHLANANSANGVETAFSLGRVAIDTNKRTAVLRRLRAFAASGSAISKASSAQRSSGRIGSSVDLPDLERPQGAVAFSAAPCTRWACSARC